MVLPTPITLVHQNTLCQIEIWADVAGQLSEVAGGRWHIYRSQGVLSILSSRPAEIKCSGHVDFGQAFSRLPVRWWLPGVVCPWVLCEIHPKLRNIYIYNVTHSIISRNPNERMIFIQISLLIVTFRSLISWVFFWSLMHTTKEVNPNLCIVPCVNMESVFFFLFFIKFFFLGHLLSCWCMDMSHCSGRPSGRLACEDG